MFDSTYSVAFNVLIKVLDVLSMLDTNSLLIIVSTASWLHVPCIASSFVQSSPMLTTPCVYL